MVSPEIAQSWCPNPPHWIKNIELKRRRMEKRRQKRSSKGAAKVQKEQQEAQIRRSAR